MRVKKFNSVDEIPRQDAAWMLEALRTIEPKKGKKKPERVFRAFLSDRQIVLPSGKSTWSSEKAVLESLENYLNNRYYKEVDQQAYEDLSIDDEAPITIEDSYYEKVHWLSNQEGDYAREEGSFAIDMIKALVTIREFPE